MIIDGICRLGLSGLGIWLFRGLNCSGEGSLGLGLVGFRASAERTIGLLKLNSYLQFESFRSEPQSARPSRRTFSAATNAWILFRRRHGIALRGGLEQMLGPQVLRVPSRSCKPAGRHPRTARNRLKMIGSRFPKLQSLSLAFD